MWAAPSNGLGSWTEGKGEKAERFLTGKNKQLPPAPPARPSPPPWAVLSRCEPKQPFPSIPSLSFQQSYHSNRKGTDTESEEQQGLLRWISRCGSQTPLQESERFAREVLNATPLCELPWYIHSCAPPQDNIC